MRKSEITDSVLAVKTNRGVAICHNPPYYFHQKWTCELPGALSDGR